MNRLRFIQIAALTLAALVFHTNTANAHRSGESYVYINVTDEDLSGKVHVTFDHLSNVVDMDANDDGVVTKDEFDSKKGDIYALMEERVQFFDGDKEHPIVVTGHNFIDPEGELWASILYDVPTMGTPPEQLDAQYRFLFDDQDPTHRGLLIIESNTRAGISENEAQHSLIFKPGRERQSFKVDGVPKTSVFGRFLEEGIYHIVPIGYDHILFLISLLLPSVMVLQAGVYQPAPGFREPFWHVVKVVSFFTIAHTITLTLATLDVINLPSRFVEAVIALSIAIVAVNNLKPFMSSRIWTIVFLLGLFHGLGFANVLDPFTYRKQAMLAPLAGFNIGVEIGQLMVVGAVFPILYFLRKQPFYKPIILQGGSIVLALIALFWFFERTFLG